MSKLDSIILPDFRFQSSKTEGAPGRRLRLGDVVSGKIIGHISPRQVLLSIGGRRIIARVSTTLSGGADAVFRVIKDGPECVLKLMEMRQVSSDQMGAYTRGIGTGSDPIRSLFDMLRPVLQDQKTAQNLPAEVKKMWALLTQISVDKNQGVDPACLKNFVACSGLSWEQKLKAMVLNGQTSQKSLDMQIQGDLKGLALQVLSHKAGSQFLQTEAFKTCLESIEKIQLLNISSFEQSGRLILFLPLSFNDQLRIAQCLIDMGGKSERKGKGGKESALRVSLFLDMSSLGPVRIDATIQEEAIAIGFSVASRKTQKLFEIHFESLKNGIGRHGFVVQQVTCRLEKRQVLEETNFVTSLMEGKNLQINVII